jgi:hypothetical protein
LAMFLLILYSINFNRGYGKFVFLVEIAEDQ